jgi:hypothetical protein
MKVESKSTIHTNKEHGGSQCHTPDKSSFFVFFLKFGIAVSTMQMQTPPKTHLWMGPNRTTADSEAPAINVVGRAK